MTHSLNGKTALVTGGGRGIGAAIALKLAGLGATVVVCGRTLARLQHTAGQIRSAGGQGEAMACDVADWASVAALADRVTAIGVLELDDFGAEIRQQRRGNRPGDHATQLQDAHTVQGSFILRVQITLHVHSVIAYLLFVNDIWWRWSSATQPG